LTQQILRNTGALLSQTFYTDETPVNADGAVTVTVTTADGTVVSTGPATSAGIGSGEYTYSLAPRSALGLLTVTWAGVFGGVAQSLTSTVEIVGGFFVALAEIRALPDMNDTGKYPTADLIKARHWFETRFEAHTCMAFVPRAATERLNGRCSTLMLKHWPVREIIAVRSYTSPTVNVAFTVDELADLLVDSSGIVQRYSTGYWPVDVEVDYEHGQAAPPADVKDVALVAIREKLIEDVSGSRGNRQFSVATQDGIVRSSTPDADRPFGIPSVDAVANDYRSRYRVPAVA
jgi:hypothetical protein